MGVQLSYKEGVLTASLSGEIDHHAARPKLSLTERASKLIWA